MCRRRCTGERSSRRDGKYSLYYWNGGSIEGELRCSGTEPAIHFKVGAFTDFYAMLDESEIAYRRNGGENRLPGLISLSFPGKDGETILHRMDLMGISISTGSACDSVNTENSHVLQAIMLDEEHSKGTVRISLGKNNTEAEAGRIAEALIRIIV